jgi:hypothetical protein
MGLLDSTPDEQREWARQKNLAKAQERHDDERCADLQRKLADIERALEPILKEEIALEAASVQVTKRMRADFAAFKRYCLQEGFPFLPAPPAAVCEYLGLELKHGRAHVSRIANAISAVHVAASEVKDPLSDLLCRAFMRCVRTDQSSPQSKEVH